MQGRVIRLRGKLLRQASGLFPGQLDWLAEEDADVGRVIVVRAHIVQIGCVRDGGEAGIG